MLKEMQSPPLQFLLPNGEVDPAALHVIRDVLEEEEAQPEVAQAQGASQPMPVARVRAATLLQEAAPLAAQAPRPKPVHKQLRRAIAFRPTMMQALGLAFVAACVLAPWVVFGVFVSLLFAFTAALVYFGVDEVWGRILHRARRLAKRYPRRAVRLRRAYMRVAGPWNGLLEQMPGEWFDGLYLPDVREMAAAEHKYRIALNRRFAALREDLSQTLQ